MRDYASIALRLALGLTFLYAIADRLGLLGGPGAPNVSWGNFSRFTAYVGTLNWYVPHLFVPALAWVETVLETLLGVALVLGALLRPIAFVSGLLLLSFALTMSVAGGIGAPFAASVFTASAAAFMLAAAGSARWSIRVPAPGLQRCSLRYPTPSQQHFRTLKGRSPSAPRSLADSAWPDQPSKDL